MKVGILETGAPRPHLIERHGRYDAMVTRMLGPGFETVTFDIQAGHRPSGAEDFAAFVITGSSAGVYDPLPWIEPLKRFLRDLDGRIKLVGLCFGHQIMAEAFGGRVEKSARGWGLGLHDYTVQERATWMDDAHVVAVPASHQDQVVEPPPGAVLLGGSAFTPFGMLAYPARDAISFQVHPEFDNDFAAELIELRRATLPPGAADRAVDSLRTPGDAGRVGGWIRRFIAGDPPMP